MSIEGRAALMRLYTDEEAKDGSGPLYRPGAQVCDLLVLWRARQGGSIVEATLDLWAPALREPC